MALKGHSQGHLLIPEGIIKLWLGENPGWNCNKANEIMLLVSRPPIFVFSWGHADYGVPNVPKMFINDIFVYPHLIYKYDTDLAG